VPLDSRAGRAGNRQQKKRQDGVAADLADYAAHHFALDIARPDGTTKRDELLSALRQAKQGWVGAPSVASVEAELDGPSLPSDGAHVWAWYVELDRARSATGFGPAALGWQDIAAWASLMRCQPMPWECLALTTIDRIFRFEWAKAQPKPGSSTPGGEK
jgi:hypothetical protein